MTMVWISRFTSTLSTFQQTFLGDRVGPILQVEMENPVKLRVCDHIFEKNSIEQWLQINPTCPLCRRNVRA